MNIELDFEKIFEYVDVPTDDVANLLDETICFPDEIDAESMIHSLEDAVRSEEPELAGGMSQMWKILVCVLFIRAINVEAVCSTEIKNIATSSTLAHYKRKCEIHGNCKKYYEIQECYDFIHANNLLVQNPTAENLEKLRQFVSVVGLVKNQYDFSGALVDIVTPEYGNNPLVYNFLATALTFVQRGYSVPQAILLSMIVILFIVFSVPVLTSIIKSYFCGSRHTNRILPAPPAEEGQMISRPSQRRGRVTPAATEGTVRSAVRSRPPSRSVNPSATRKRRSPSRPRGGPRDSLKGGLNPLRQITLEFERSALVGGAHCSYVTSWVIYIVLFHIYVFLIYILLTTDYVALKDSVDSPFVDKIFETINPYLDALKESPPEGVHWSREYLFKFSENVGKIIEIVRETMSVATISKMILALKQLNVMQALDLPKKALDFSSFIVWILKSTVYIGYVTQLPISGLTHKLCPMVEKKIENEKKVRKRITKKIQSAEKK